MCVLLSHTLHTPLHIWLCKEEFDYSWNKTHYTEIRKAKFLAKR